MYDLTQTVVGIVFGQAIDDGVLIQNLVINNQTQYLVENQNFQNSIINYLSKNYTLNSLCEIVHNLTQITIAIADYNLRLQDSSNDNNWNTELYNLRVSALHHRIPIGETLTVSQ